MTRDDALKIVEILSDNKCLTSRAEAENVIYHEFARPGSGSDGYTLDDELYNGERLDAAIVEHMKSLGCAGSSKSTFVDGDGQPWTIIVTSKAVADADTALIMGGN